MWLFKLTPNPVERFYRGGEWIARFRRAAYWPAQAPEEWLASTTTVYGERELGLSRLPHGELLRDRINAEPDAFLGPAPFRHSSREPEILVKLLHAGQRLPVHLHPDDRVASRQVGYPRGKTEGWFVIHAEPSSAVWLGFARPVQAEDLARVLAARDSAQLLDMLNRVPVQVGDALYVPAGTPHAIGEGVVIVEVQQASDLSILLEWWPFDSSLEAQWHLGLGMTGALAAVDYTVWDPARLQDVIRTVPGKLGRQRLFPEEADRFFRSERVGVAATLELEAAYQILVVLEGSGTVSSASGDELTLETGDVLLAAYAAGTLHLAGQLDMVRCLCGVS